MNVPEERLTMSSSKPSLAKSISPESVAGGIPPVSLGDRSHLTPARKAWVRNVSILLRHKRLILLTTLLATVLAGVYAFTMMPNYFTATSVVLPARKAGGVLDNITSGLAGSLKDLGVAKLGGSDESYTPLSLMTSRELQRKVTQQFNFQQIYGDPTLEDATDEFSSHLSGELSSEGNFAISFEDQSPVRAANVTNAVVAALNDINSQLAKEEAKHNLAYVEARYKKNESDLDSAERALGEFQRRYGVFALPDQAKAELAAVAGIEQQKSMAEIQLQNAQQVYGTNSSEASVAQNTVDQLASKIGQMRAGMDSKASSFVPTNVMPQVALEYLRVMREVEIQSKLKAFVLPAYEQGQLDENKVLFGFVTLDRAVPPIHKSKPHRSIILLAVFMSALVLTASIVLIIAHLQEARASLMADRIALGV